MDLKSISTEKAPQSRVVQVILNADLRCQHDGLTAIAKTFGLNVNTLKCGEYVVFVNTRQSAIKMYAANNTVAHFKLPSDRKLDLRVIGLIPRFFNGSKVDYEGALKKVLETKVRK
jgi:hypothetical protein